MRITFIVLLPLFVWLLVASYKEIKREFHITNDREFLFRIVWLIGLLFAVATSIAIVVLDSSISVSLKPL